MHDFLFIYGLFVLKLLTLIILLLFTLVLVLLIVHAKRNINDFTLEIENINAKIEDLRDGVEEEVLEKQELKTLQKTRKKEKKLIKDLPQLPKLFVLDFAGDLQATASENLRWEISTIIKLAKPNDAVLLLLESQGGVVHGYGLAAAQLQRLREHNIKLIVAVDLIAASGGYMMAAVADHIIAAPFAIIGSIGVIAQLPNFNKLLTKHDIDIEQHYAGEYKSTLNMLAKNTDKGREKFKEELTITHQLFKDFVNKHRPQVHIQKIATGEYWYGSLALELGLIDQVQTSDEFLLNAMLKYNIFKINYIIKKSWKEKFQKIIGMLTKFTNNALYAKL